ncbi:MAG: VTC domain-containing protein [Saccharofermentans sp.]|nr:VTC domain-containing protein [Saccharofermentans sp.]
MQEANSYRHELKFMVSYADYLAMRARFKAVMQPDPHVQGNGRYLIRSIYFDNSNDKALKEKIDGIRKREKFRIRFYNDDLTYISLEKKIKNGSLCLISSGTIRRKHA